MTAWPSVPLGEIFEIARGGSPRPIEDYITDAENGLNWVSISDASDSSKYIERTKRKIRPEGVARSRTVQPGDFLLTNSMSFGRPYIMRTTGCIHDGWLVLEKKRENVDQDFFFHLLGSKEIYSKFVRLASGATVKNLNIDLVKGVSVPLPPLAEQRRIAAILDQTDALRAKRREALAQLDSLTKSIYVDMFGDPASNPMAWPTLPFNTACETRLGKMLDRGKQNGKNARKYLRNANVQWFRFDLGVVYEMDFDQSERNLFALREGDLLICEGGQPGRAAIWRGELEECYYQKALHRGRPNPKIANSDYLVWLLWFMSNQGGLSDHVTSATIAHLTSEKLKAIKIPVPPLPIQEGFSEHLREIERVSHFQRAALGETEALFSSLQHRAFRGEL